MSRMQIVFGGGEARRSEAIVVVVVVADRQDKRQDKERDYWFGCLIWAKMFNYAT